MIKVTNEIRDAARRLLTNAGPSDKATLQAIVEGKRKLIDPVWWSKVHGDVDRAKRDKIAAMADPARNPNEHERKVAETKLAAAKARRPPGMPPEPPPLPSDLKEWIRRERKTKTPTSSQPVRRPSDSVAVAHTSDSVEALKAMNERSEERLSDSVAA